MVFDSYEDDLEEIEKHSAEVPYTDCKIRVINERKRKSSVDEVQKVAYWQLYRYATCTDQIFMIMGIIFTLLAGIANPLMMKYFGDVTESFVVYGTERRRVNITSEELERADVLFYDGIRDVLVANIVLGALTVLFSYLGTVLFHYTAHKQILKIRTYYFESMINQDFAWYDTHQTGDFIIRMTEDLAKIQEGIGAKVTIFLFYFSVFIAAIIFALVLGWKLALVCMVCCPVSVLTMGFMTWITTKFTRTEIESYGCAGAIAEEVIGAIKTVSAFEGQDKEHERYKKHLIDAEKNNIKRSIFLSLANGFLWFNIYASMSLAFWYGVKLMLEDKYLPEDDVTYTTSVMISVCFATFSANWSFGQCSPYFDMFATAQTAAYKIFKVIDNMPFINSAKECGNVPSKILGNITFTDVFFEYPSRQDVKILRGLNLSIKCGETVALVGGSGCGKSTCIQLIQRFYDPTCGSVFLDGNNVKSLNLTWLRSHIGVVGQEPVLFATTIANNIKYGNKHATQSEIEEAAKKANVHSFIMTLPDGYNTMVGERGAQLSGGQKQRIAIARALVRKPTILLLDEATSALDTNSEAVVQAALDEAGKESTTIIVAHRLSTIRDADRIIVLSDGAVVEDGTHKELMKSKGHYYNLVMRQANESEFQDVGEEEEDESVESDVEIKKDLERVASYIDDTDDNLEDEHYEKRSTKKALCSVLKMNKPEWLHIIIGCISSIGSGAALPIYAIFYGTMMKVLSSDDDDVIYRDISNCCLYLLLIGIMSGICSFIQMHMFNIAGERLTKRVRSNLFRAILNQEQGWFDNEINGVGAICTRLSNDAAYVQGASGQPIGAVINSFSCLGLSMALSLYFEWRTTLVTLCFVPLIFVVIYLEQKIMNTNETNKSFEESSKLAVEAISNIRTVVSLGCEETFISMYSKKLEEYFEKTKHGGHFQGVTLGMARAMIFFAYGASFFYGGTLVLYKSIDYGNILKVTESLVMSAWSLGSAVAYTPNFQKGVSSAGNIINLISRTPRIRNRDNVQQLIWDTGNINYSKITFTYPNRPNIRVLRGIDLQIKKGKTVAFVGASGCGKSTLIQLLQRFYDPNTGAVSLDDTNIKDITLQSLRSNFGIVSQEPVLFDRTIAENIAYGDNERVVRRAEIIEAAKSANIHNFITGLPQGYDTRAGEKGTQLSGGQKQRMAIARALIRNPKVLLLDEATSALDAESEKIVQEALDNAKKDRTCITIAHRLTTIKDADVICVVNRGKIEEMGTHNELLQKKGLYYNLQMLQK